MDSTPASKRRKLSNKKCARCRKDKKACTPYDRQWPGQRCDFCARYDYPCSASRSCREEKAETTRVLPQRSDPLYLPMQTGGVASGIHDPQNEVDVLLDEIHGQLVNIEHMPLAALDMGSTGLDGPPGGVDTGPVSAAGATLAGLDKRMRDWTEEFGYLDCLLKFNARTTELNRSFTTPLIPSAQCTTLWQTIEILKGTAEIRGIILTGELREKGRLTDAIIVSNRQKGGMLWISSAPTLVAGLEGLGDFGSAERIQESAVSRLRKTALADKTRLDEGVRNLIRLHKISVSRERAIADRLGLTFDDILKGAPLLHRSILFSSKDVLSTLISNTDLDLGEESILGQSAILVAAGTGNFEAAELLLNAGANIEAKDSFGRTALQYASSTGYGEVVELLLERNANIEARDNHGWTPLHFASQTGYDRVVELIIDHRPDLIDIQNNEGETALALASREGRRYTIGELLLRGANVEIENKFGQRPLHLAAVRGYCMIVQLLLEEGARVNVHAGTWQATALHMAAGEGHQATVQVLLDVGADENAHNVLHETPLHSASRGGHEKVAQLLLEKSSNPMAPNVAGESAVTLAFEGNHSSVLRLLLNRMTEIEAASKFDEFEDLVYQAVDTGDRDLLRHLLGIETGGGTAASLAKRSSEINMRRNSLACTAARRGCKDIVKLLLTTEPLLRVEGILKLRCALHR